MIDIAIEAQAKKFFEKQAETLNNTDGLLSSSFARIFKILAEFNFVPTFESGIEDLYHKQVDRLNVIQNGYGQCEIVFTHSHTYVCVYTNVDSHYCSIGDALRLYTDVTPPLQGYYVDTRQIIIQLSNRDYLSRFVGLFDGPQENTIAGCFTPTYLGEKVIQDIQMLLKLGILRYRDKTFISNIDAIEGF